MRFASADSAGEIYRVRGDDATVMELDEAAFTDIDLALFAVVEGVIFILILFVGLVYAWRKGMLEWA